MQADMEITSEIMRICVSKGRQQDGQKCSLEWQQVNRTTNKGLMDVS